MGNWNWIVQMWCVALKAHSRSGIAGHANIAKIAIMIPMAVHAITILVVEETQEMRDGITALLERDRYRIWPARDEEEAVAKIHATSPPDLILVSLEGTTKHLLDVARGIRDRAGLTATPVVIFSNTNFPEGIEQEIGGNIFITAPDNFDQLRALLIRILRHS